MFKVKKDQRESYSVFKISTFIFAYLITFFLFHSSVEAFSNNRQFYGAQPLLNRARPIFNREQPVFNRESPLLNRVRPSVKVIGRNLVADFDKDGHYKSFLIKGVGYSPFPITRHPSDWDYPNPENDPRSTNIFDDPAILERDFKLLQSMNANTIRIWKGNDTELKETDAAKNLFKGQFPAKITQRTLDIAEKNQIKVIAGFWIDQAGEWGACSDDGPIFHRWIDFTDHDVRDGIKLKFAQYVKEFKDHPAILFWAIGNENNLNFSNDPNQIKAFYSLVNEMAKVAHDIEGKSFHPVAFVNGEIQNIGKADLGTTDRHLRHLDIWGANIYRGESFGTLFDEFARKSRKPLWISEFGADAWHTNDVNNPSDGFEDQETQANWGGKLWDEIVANKRVSIGGTIMEYSDEWWKPNEWGCAEGITDETEAKEAVALCNRTQEYLGSGPRDFSCPKNGTFDDAEDYIPAAPDQYNNEEWWGIMSISKKSAESMEADVMTPRKIYFTLQEKFEDKNQPPVFDSIEDKTVKVGDILYFRVQAKDPEKTSVSISAELGSGEPLSKIGARLIDTRRGLAVFAWRVVPTHLGNVVPIKFTATDKDGSSSTETVLITMAASTKPAKMISPVSGSTLVGSTVEFKWDPGVGVDKYQFYVFRDGRKIFFNTKTTKTSVVVNNLPQDGKDIKVYLWSKINGRLTDGNSGPYVYKTSKIAQPSQQVYGEVTEELNGKLVPKRGVKVTAMGKGVRGSVYTGKDGMYKIEHLFAQTWTITPSLEGYTFTPEHVDLEISEGEILKPINFVANKLNTTLKLAEMISPEPGSTLMSRTIEFEWDQGIGVNQYYLFVGTSLGRSNIYRKSTGQNTSAMVLDIPPGKSIYVRLWSNIDGRWKKNDYTYIVAEVYDPGKLRRSR